MIDIVQDHQSRQDNTSIPSPLHYELWWSSDCGAAQAVPPNVVNVEAKLKSLISPHLGL